MPIKPGAVRRAYQRDAYRRKVAEKKIKVEKEKIKAEKQYVPPNEVDDQIRALINWSSSLKVAPGHPRVDKPMTIPDFLTDYLRGALKARESLLCVARKNGKSSCLAVLSLAYLIGVLRVPGWRGAVVSLNLAKSREFLRLCWDLIEHNSLPLKVYKSLPGRIRNDAINAELECLSSSDAGGHASGFDAVFLDELGLFEESSRQLVRSLYSSISARDGRIFALSIRGDSPFLEEIIQRKDDEDVFVQLYESSPECSILDEDEWRRSNPGLGTIKSLSSMRFSARSAAATPADLRYFRSHELNQKLKPDSQVIVSVDDWIKCETDQLALSSGVAYLGFDLGAVSSMTSAVCYWPSTGRMQCWGCFPSVPGLDKRAQDDGIGDAYDMMIQEGSLRLFGDRLPDYPAFLEWVLSELGNAEIVAVSYDRFRKPEIESLLDDLGILCERFPRGTGASSRADGSHDCRAFQRAVLTESLSVERLMMWRSALRFAELRFDVAGNPALNKSIRRGRIDAISAATLAIGTASVNKIVERRAPLFYA